MTFSRPLTLAASSATALMLLPATKPVIEPPSFCAAVTAANDPGLSLPSRCSSTARVESSRAMKDWWGSEIGRTDLSWVRAWRSAVLRTVENMVTAGVRKETGEGRMESER